MNLARGNAMNKTLQEINMVSQRLRDILCEVKNLTTDYFNKVICFVALTIAGTTPSIAGGCPQGTVWREATPSDHVCVSPEIRAQTWSDNKTNPYESCPRGLVWREATSRDHLCVDPSTRAQTWNDNANAPKDTISPIPGQRHGID